MRERDERDGRNGIESDDGVQVLRLLAAAVVAKECKLDCRETNANVGQSRAS